MIEASGEESDSDEENETADPPAECPAHKPTTMKAKGVMTDKEVYANAAGFLIAGNETTSILLSYTSYLLALNPDVQEKLQSEIDSYFEDNPVRLEFYSIHSIMPSVLDGMHNSYVYMKAAWHGATVADKLCGT